MAITKRLTKGSALTHAELDANFDEILDLRRISTDQVTAGGTANALTASFTQTVSLSDGVIVKVKIASTNTAASPTLNVSATGAKTITNLAGSPLGSGVLIAGSIILFSYDSGSDSWVALNYSSTDALTLNGQTAAYYLNSTNQNAGTLPAARLPQATTAAVGGTRYATTAETTTGTETEAAVTPSGLLNSTVHKPTFVTPTSVASGSSSASWTTADAGSLVSAPSTATIIILEATGAMSSPDSGDDVADIMIRSESGASEYTLLRGKASGGGDEVAWVGQGFFPMKSDQTFQYEVESPGFNDNWAIKIVGYW